MGEHVAGNWAELISICCDIDLPCRVRVGLRRNENPLVSDVGLTTPHAWLATVIAASDKTCVTVSLCRDLQNV